MLKRVQAINSLRPYGLSDETTVSIVDRVAVARSRVDAVKAVHDLVGGDLIRSVNIARTVTNALQRSWCNVMKGEF